MQHAACSVQRGCRLQPQKRSRLSSPRALAAQRRLATSTWTLRGLAGRAASHPNPITHSHWHRCGPSCVRCGKAGIHPAHRRLTVAVTLGAGRAFVATRISVRAAATSVPRQGSPRLAGGIGYRLPAAACRHLASAPEVEASAQIGTRVFQGPTGELRALAQAKAASHGAPRQRQS